MTECYRKEKEARSVAEQTNISLSTELEKVCDEKSAIERKVILLQLLFKYFSRQVPPILVLPAGCLNNFPHSFCYC